MAIYERWQIDFARSKEGINAKSLMVKTNAVTMKDTLKCLFDLCKADCGVGHVRYPQCLPHSHKCCCLPFQLSADGSSVWCDVIWCDIEELG